MRKLMFLALGAIVGLSFMACGNKPAPVYGQGDSTAVDSSKMKDVTVYGLCGENAAMNSLQLMTDMGDTLNLNIEEARENNQVLGNYAPGDRLAIVLTPDQKKVKTVINESVLMGNWLMPNPIDGSSEVGIRIKDGGIAESIEQSTIIYKTWKIIDGKLEITLVREGGGDEEETNWYTIDKLDADSLIYHVDDEVFEYGRAK
ncbi:MAG: lipocalin family protein [Prevotella sp.]